MLFSPVPHRQRRLREAGPGREGNIARQLEAALSGEARVLARHYSEENETGNLRLPQSDSLSPAPRDKLFPPAGIAALGISGKRKLLTRFDECSLLRVACPKLVQQKNLHSYLPAFAHALVLTRLLNLAAEECLLPADTNS